MKRKLRLAALLVMVTTVVSACAGPVVNNGDDRDQSSSPAVTVIETEVKESTGEVGSESEESLNIGSLEYSRADLLLKNIQSGGVPQDGIPSIDEPVYVSVEEAYSDFLPKDQFFVVELEDETYLFPQSILVWHEIVNLEGHDLAVTYCPLTGSCITYEHPEGLETSFGTSGKLINSNLLMYDRSTDVYISQIDGVGLEDELLGYELQTVPTYWIRWETAREAYPDALVLTDDTGYIRDYKRDPYGSYTEDVRSNYYISDGVIFPVMALDADDHFMDKHMVVGVKYKGERAAIDPALVKAEGNYNFELAGEMFTAVHDAQIDTVRVYFAESDESPTHFEIMWFAWYAFYPATEVIK